MNWRTEKMIVVMAVFMVYISYNKDCLEAPTFLGLSRNGVTMRQKKPREMANVEIDMIKEK